MLQSQWCSALLEINRQKLFQQIHIYLWDGVKVIYRWNFNFNDIWLSLHRMSKYSLKFNFRRFFSISVLSFVVISVSDPHLLLCVSGSWSWSQHFSIWIRIQGVDPKKHKWKKILKYKTSRIKTVFVFLLVFLWGGFPGSFFPVCTSI